MDNTTIIKSEIILDEQILASKNEAMFIARIVELREKAIKVDYCWESVWGNSAINVFSYTTWIPKSVIIHDEHGCLTLKKWFVNNGLKKDKIYNIKKYFIVNGEKKFV